MIISSEILKDDFYIFNENVIFEYIHNFIKSNDSNNTEDL